MLRQTTINERLRGWVEFNASLKTILLERHLNFSIGKFEQIKFAIENDNSSSRYLLQLLLWFDFSLRLLLNPPGPAAFQLKGENIFIITILQGNITEKAEKWKS